MTFPFFWRGPRSGVPAAAATEDARPGQLCKLLDAAKIEYRRDAPELTLRSLPATSAPENPLRVEAQPFSFPLAPPARIAMLGGGFHLGRNIREFDVEDIVWLHSYAPEALVLALDPALSLADRKSRGLFELQSLKTAIVVLTSLADSPLADHHRDLLWQAFGVPIFEQLRGWDGTVIARECEVHDGLHIDEAAAIFHLCQEELLATQLTAPGNPIIRARTGLTGEIASGRCECGAETPRLRNLAAVPIKASVAAA